MALNGRPCASAISTISIARTIRSSVPVGIVAPVEERTTGDPRSAAIGSTSTRSAAAELRSGAPPPAHVGSTRPRPTAMTEASDESIDSGTVETGPTTPTSHVIAARRPSTSGETSSTFRSRYAAPPAICRTAIHCT